MDKPGFVSKAPFIYDDIGPEGEIQYRLDVGNLIGMEATCEKGAIVYKNKSDFRGKTIKDGHDSVNMIDIYCTFGRPVTLLYCDCTNG